MEELIDHLLQTELRQDRYHYLLLDPLKAVSCVNPLHINKLKIVREHDAVVIVQRPDLAHSPQHCPLLVCLACPGEDIPRDIVRASIEYARKEIEQEKRYVCGWLSSVEPINIVAKTLAERASQAGQTMGNKQVLPFYEPLRFELLHAEKRFNEFIWPVSQWWYMSASGCVVCLDGKIPENRWQPEWGALRNQQEIRGIWGVLFAWRRVSGALPDDAVVKAVIAWTKTAKYGLPHSHDRQYLALNELTLSIDITKHPYVQSLIKQAASQPTLRLTQLMASVPDDAWQELNGNTGGKYDA